MKRTATGRKGERVRVCGSIPWEPGWHINVATDATVIDWKKGPNALVSLDNVDGFSNYVCHVKKKYISKLDVK